MTTIKLNYGQVVESTMWWHEYLAQPQFGVTILVSKEIESSEVEDRILAVATDLFATLGYASVKVPEIATNAKVGLNTLYRYYPSKESLGNAVFRRCKTIWLNATLDRWPVDVAPPEQFQFYWSELVHYGDQYHTVAVHNEREPQGFEFDVPSTALKRRIDRRVDEILGAWVASKQVKDLPQEVLKALIHGTFQKILELPISKRKRRQLFEHAGAAIWNSIATLEFRLEDGFPSEVALRKVKSM